MASESRVSVSMGWPEMRCFSVTPVQKLHGDERLAVLLANVVNGADVGMIQSGSRLSFALETGQGLRVAGNFVEAEISGRRNGARRVSSAL